MNGKCFFDTNVLVYSFQTSEEKRSLTALDLVTTATEAGAGGHQFSSSARVLLRCLSEERPSHENGRS